MSFPMDTIQKMINSFLIKELKSLKREKLMSQNFSKVWKHAINI